MDCVAKPARILLLATLAATLITLLAQGATAQVVVPDGYATYQVAGSTVIRGDNFSGGDFTASEDQLQDVGGQPRFLVTRWSWDRNETITIAYDDLNDINLVITNMSDPARSTILTTELTGAGPANTFRTADVAYEQESGRALIVWDTSTSDGTINYNIWNGTDLSATDTVTLPTLSTTRRFLKLTSRGGSNDIMLAYNDGLADIGAILWNGTGWEAGLYATATGVSIANRRSFDFTWMHSGDGIFFYSHNPGSPNNGAYFQTFTYGNKSWGPQTLADPSTVVATATTRQIEACANQQNDFVGVIRQDSSGDTYTFMWNGTGVETSPAPPSPDAATEQGGDNAECEWEKNGKQAFFSFIDNNALSLDYYTYDLSVDLATRSWSTNDLTSTFNTGNIASDDVQSVITDNHPTNDRIAILFKDLVFDLRGVVWNGSDLEAVPTNGLLTADNTGGATASAQSQSFSFAWQRLGLRSPDLIGAIDDNSNTSDPTNEGSNVTFSANATNSYGTDWYLLICNDADQQDGNCGPAGEICRSALTPSSSVASCQFNTSGQALTQYAWLGYACNDLGACSAYDRTNSPYEVNHAPTNAPSISPGSPDVTDTLSCTANAVDSDSDSVTNAFRWLVQDEGVGAFDEVSGQTSNQLTSAYFDSNDVVRCAVTTTDVHDFSALENESASVTVAQGTLSASSTLGTTTIDRWYTTTIDASCTVTTGDAESVTLLIQDDSSGGFAQSSTTPLTSSVWVNQSSFDLGRLASETSPTVTATIFGNTSGVYQFRAQCQASDAAPSLANSTPETLTVSPDATAPVVTGRTVSVTNETANVMWNTDDLADSLVEYGLTTALGSSVFDPSRTNGHDILLTNLDENTNYFYNITTCNVDGICSEEGPFTFKTIGPELGLPFESGYCTGQYIERSDEPEDGFLKRGDVFEYWCETPYGIRPNDQFTLTLVIQGLQLRKTFTAPYITSNPLTPIYP